MDRTARLPLTRIAIAGVVVALAAFAAFAVAQPSPAAAQLPAICEQYPQLPQCQEEIIVPPVTQPPPGAVPTAPSATATAGAPIGTLPFTGYPITPLLLLLLSLLLSGLTIRAYLAVRDRIREGHSQPPSGT